jgi:hypothetical protein
MVFNMAAIELHYPVKANIRRGMLRRDTSDAFRAKQSRSEGSRQP